MNSSKAECRNIASLIREYRSQLLDTWRAKLKSLPSTKTLDKPTLNDHIPDFLEELAGAFQDVADGKSDSEATRIASSGSSVSHGLQRFQNGFEVEEIVKEYNIMRGCIHDLAARHEVNLQGRPFHVLNQMLDQAIGTAVRIFALQQALEVQRRREDYLAFVAHDLRTPLGAINLAATILESRFMASGEDERAARTFRSLHRNIGYLSNMVNKVLEENANLQTEVGVKLECRTFDLWPLVESLVYDLHPIAGTDSTKLINNVPETLTLFADAGLIRRVFQNLIANALEHTKYGEVVISAHMEAADGAVVCSVADNGIGIAEERLALVFEKFETDGKTSRTHGLGLTICKAFVEAHGGRIEVRSKPGQGAVFTFTLPNKPPHISLQR